MPKLIQKPDDALTRDWRAGVQRSSSTNVVIPNEIQSQPIASSIVKGDATPKMINIRDKRRVRYTSGEPVSDSLGNSKTGVYPTSSAVKTVNQSKIRGVDPWNPLAVSFQESKLGKDDPDNPGHIVNQDFTQSTGEADMVNVLQDKMAEGKRLGYKDELHQLQMYNGMGNLRSDSDKSYNIKTGQGSSQKKWYGVPIPPSGIINMKDNPLYGKEVTDLRDNVLKKSTDIQNIVDTTGTQGGVLIKNGVKYTNPNYLKKAAANRWLSANTK